MDNEDRLITDLINRYSVQIKFKKNQGYQTSDQLQQNVLRKHNEQTLIDLSSTKLNLVANGLSDILDSLTKKKDKEEPNEHNQWAQSYTLGLLAKCMEHQWHHIKSQYRTMSKSVADETEAMKLREKEEQLLPPPLQDTMASRIIALSSACLIRCPSDSDMYVNSGKLIYQLSATNYDQVYTKITDILSAIVSASSSSVAADETITSQLMMIEHINLNSHLLCELLERLLKSAASFRKEKHQFTLAMVMRRAIWNWIENHPMEFVQLTRSGGRLSNAPDLLFDILDGWAKKTIHRNCIWPLMTMLLLLCPDLMIKLQRNEKHSNNVMGSGDLSVKRKFIDTLKKSVKVSKLADVVSICYLDIFKASVYVADSDVTILKPFANSIESELKDRFIVQQKGSELESINLETDFVVTTFKSSAKKLSTLLPDLLAGDSSPSFKIVLLKAILKIVMDDVHPNKLPWCPSLSEAYPVVSLQLKQLFIECLQSVRSMSGSLPKAPTDKGKKHQDKLLYDIHIINLLVQLYHLDPKFAMFPARPTPAQDLDDFKAIMVGLCLIASSQTLLADLVDMAGLTLVKMHQPSTIESWYDKKLTNGFWEISSAINTSLANSLVDQRDLPLEHIQRLFILLNEVISCRNKFLYQSRDSLLPTVSIREVRSQGSSKLEYALLVHLCSSEPDICLRSAIIFGLLAEEIDIIGETAEDSNGIIIHQAIYKKLAASCQAQHTGKKHQQKAIRTLLRHITTPTTGNVAAWDELFSRWTATTPLIINITDDINNEKINGLKKALNVIKQEWYNMIGFLCSLSGVVLSKDTFLPSGGSSSGATSNSASGSAAASTSSGGPVSQLKTRSRKLTNAPVSTIEKTKMIAAFINDLTDLIVSENIFIRDSTVSLMGTALCPSSFEWLLKHLHTEVSGCFLDANTPFNEQAMEKSNLFIDQTINVLKFIVDPQNSNTDDLDFANVGALERLVLIIMKYINHLPAHNYSISAVRLKKNICALLDFIIGKKSTIQISFDFKRSLLDLLIDWTAIFNPNNTANQTSSIVNGNTLASGNTLSHSLSSESILADQPDTKNIDLSCVGLISNILNSLLFSTNEHAGLMQFKKYYNIFFNQLTKKTELMSENKPMNDALIQCICNMIYVNSNYDYFVQTGYNEDADTRAAFLQVAANVIKLSNLNLPQHIRGGRSNTLDGIALDGANGKVSSWKPAGSSITASPSNSSISLEDTKYQQFYEILLQAPDYHVLIAMSQINDSDDLARVLIHLYDQYDRALPALKKIIQYEISTTKTSSTSTLLRGNSLGSKMLAYYIKMIGTPYLKQALCTPIGKILANNASMEIDTTKLGPTEDVHANITKLSLLAKIFIRSIQETICSVPAPIREISSYIVKELSQYHPGSEKVTVVGIVFLKYICPAVITPENFGIVQNNHPISKENRRALVLITKILQKLGSAGQQSVREPFMNNFNGFVNENSKLVDEVFDTLTSVSPDKSAIGAVRGKSTKLAWETKQEDLPVLHTTFINSVDRLGKALVAMEQPALSEQVQSVLRTLSVTLKSIQTTSEGGDNDSIAELLKRFEHTNIDYLKHKKIFYQQGYTLKDRQPVFYYIARRLDPSMDQDHLFYLMLKTVVDNTDADLSKDFTIVIDCTLSNPTHNIPLSWCSTWLRHLPQKLLSCCSIYIVNPSHYNKSHFKSIYKLVGQNYRVKMLLFLSNSARLLEHIESDNHGIPESTLAIEVDVMALYTPVVKVSQFQEKNVTIRVTNEYLQLISIKLYSLLGRSTQLVDTYSISNIKSVVSGNEDEFELKFRNGEVIIFKSSQRNQIIQSINQAIAGSETLTLNETPAISINPVPHDIPGTLLNMALLNLGSGNIALRTSAYNVLSAIAADPSFSAQCRLLDTPGLFVPKNSTQKIVQISTRLSKLQPELTLDFMLEALHGINKAALSSKYLILEYMEPWISNLSSHTRKGQSPDQVTRYKKTTNIIDLLIELTVRESGLKTIIHERVWICIGKQSEDLIGLVLQRCSLKSRETKNSEIIGEMVSSMGYTSPQPVGRRLIGRILKLLDQTAHSTTSSGELSTHMLWTQIAINLRLLMYLMFDNPICAQLYLPEIFHIITTLFCIGNVNVGITVHTLLLNTLHSLYNSMVSNDGRLSAVPYLISQLGEQKFLLLFGINTANSLVANNDFNLATESKELEKMSIANVDPVAKSIFSILKVFLDSRYEQAKQWHMRWIQLTIKAAFTTNLPVQGRALITLGNIIKNNSMCEMLIRDVLKVLGTSLKSSNAISTHSDIIYSALHCLTRLQEYLSSKATDIFSSLFWICMSFIELYDNKIFSVALAQLESLIKLMDNHQLFAEGFHPTLLLARAPYLKSLQDIDQVVGVSFENNFSFALSTHLLKGLRNASTKSSTSSLLSVILKIVSKKQTETSSILGYLALMASEGDYSFIEHQSDSGHILFNRQLVPDECHASLLLILLQAILSNTDREPEQLILFELLKEGIKFTPKTFSIINTPLTQKISSAISNCDNPKIASPALYIMNRLYGFNEDTPTNSIDKTQFDIKQIGFQGISDAGIGFQRQATLPINQSILKSTSELLDSVTDTLSKSLSGQSYPFNEADLKIDDISDDEMDKK